ncbi:MAG: acetylornithine deacetylase [Methyloligellaceae bacterium]
MSDHGYEDIMQKLIRFDTTSRYSNLEMIEFIEDFLLGYGVSSTRIPNETGDKTSLYATIGPEGISGIGLSAHTDVVPVDGQSWTSNPFELEEKEGRYYGRGTTDMKGFLSCILSLVPELTKRELHMPVHLLLSYDEEIGCIGVRPMVDELGKTLTKPKMVIVGEPSNMQVISGHKGIHAFVTEVTGKEAHSSVVDLGVNSVSYASRLIVELDRVGSLLRTSHVDERFTPSFSSVHVGKIDGGTALNIVPKKCRFLWEIRSLPGAQVDHIVGEFLDYSEKLVMEMRKVSEEAGIQTTKVNSVPTFQTAQSVGGEELLSLSLRWAGQNEIGVVSYGTEAGFFELGDCPTVICGPGSIEQAHKPDEFIEKDQMDKCMKFLRNIRDYVSKPS